MAFDAARARTALYGGSTNSSNYSDLWEWDGLAWLQRPSATPGPLPVWMIFDPRRARMIVGRYPGTFPVETWELDPATALWSFRGTAPYGPAAFDSARSLGVAINDYETTATMEYDASAAAMGPYFIQQPADGSYSPGARIALPVQPGGTPPFEYQWYRNGQSLSNGGIFSGVTSDTLVIEPAHRADSGIYEVAVTNRCSSLRSRSASISIGSLCYPNCDESTTAPFLSINDLVCFLSKFAAGDSYANCDMSSIPPMFNVNDFICFMFRFSAGCSAP